MDEQAKDISNSIKDYENINTSIISICEGAGIIKLFNETAGDSMHILKGGPKKNPSIKDILKVVDKISSENILILPNNPNILVTVKKLLEISDRENINIIHSKSIQQGISSLIYFNDSKPLEENISQMNSAVECIEEASVTIATRDININGEKIMKNQYIAILDEKIMKSFDDPQSALEYLLKDMSSRNDILTVIIGHDSIEKNHDKLEQTFLEENLDMELTIVEGNQPYYNYFIIGE